MTSERLFRLVLRLYPRAFRDLYGEEMLELLRHRARRGEWRVILFDLPQNVLAERFDAVRERRRRWRLPNMPDLVDDLRHAARRLAATPLFSLLAVLVLAFGLGANTASFSIVNAFLLRPPPFASPERLVDIYQDSDEGSPSSSSFPAYRDMAAHTRLFDGVLAAFARTVAYERSDTTEEVFVEYATSSYLEVLGMRPTMGRWFEPAEDRPGAGNTAVVSYNAWRTKLGSDLDVLGRVVRLNGAPVTIVGVGPANLVSLNPPAINDFWLSLSSLSDTFFPGAERTLERREDHWFLVKARLQDGVGVDEARSGMSVLAERLAREYPELDEHRRISVYAAGDVRIHPSVDAMLYPAASGLMAVVGLVLLLACSNLANMLLVRGAARRREVALRIAMGASRLRLLRQLLGESVLLSLAGGLLGFIMARWILGLADLLRPMFPVPLALDLAPDYRVFAFTLLLSVVTGVAFGAIPALHALGSDVVSRLRDEVPSGSGRRLSMRNVLVGLQIAISTLLLVMAGLFVRTLEATRHADTGFAASGVAAVLTDTRRAGYGPDQSDAVYEAIAERAAAEAGVVAVALASPLPLTPVMGSRTLVVEDGSPEGAVAEVRAQYVSPEYFDALRIPLLAGEGFDDARADGPPIAIVNETMARAHWSDSKSAVGRRFRFQAAPDSWVQIVGVVRDTKMQALNEPRTSLFYQPYAQTGGTRRYVLVRTASAAGLPLERLRGVLRAVDPSLPILELTTLDERLSASLQLPRFVATASLAIGALALLLAGVGLYAIVAFVVSQRTREVGIRMSLGARGSDITRLVLVETAALVAAGLGIGLALAFLLAPALEGALYGARPNDPITFVAVAVVIGLAAFAASYAPARRAAGLDPVRALRQA